MELPPGVTAVKEHGHLPSTPKAGQSFGFDNDKTSSPKVVGTQAVKMWSVLRARAKQERSKCVVLVIGVNF